MWRKTLVLLSLTLLGLSQAWCQETKMDPRIAYCPDIVGTDRLFMIALKVPVNAPEVKVTFPDSVVLLDQTKLPAKVEVRRWYFRSAKPAKQAQIVFAMPDGPLTITIDIWSFEDLRAFRTLKNAQLPRRWPLGKVLPELKEGPTVTSEAQIKLARAHGGGAEQYLKMSDDTIWNLQPDSTIPRWHWVNIQFGCPVHGAEIYAKGAYYPWIKNTTSPYSWKIECPVGHELYPSNDFGHGDMTGGDFPDDGIGGGCLVGGKHYGFIAEIAQKYCHVMLAVAPACAQSYLATGDIRYVHKALVAFCRLAVEWSYLGTMTQHRHRNNVGQVERFGQGRFDEGPFLAHSGFTVYPIDLPGYQWGHAEAYDQIFPAIDKDPDIIPYLQHKGFDIKTHEDVRRFIEENLMAVWMQGSMDLATSSNEPFTQRGLARMAEVLNYKQGSDFLDWLYDGTGHMRIFVPNTYFRDGAPYESTNGYNSMHVTALGPIVDSVEHLRSMRPEVYPEEKYPSLSKSRRYHNVFDFCMDNLLIDRTLPQIGDGGGWPKYQRLQKAAFGDGDTNAFEHAYRLFKDPKFAWALAKTPGWQPSLDFPYTRAQIEQEAAKWPDDWNDHSSLSDGYGIAILRGGQGEDKRALWMMYGRARGHIQDNIMDLGLAAYKGVLLTTMGYPRNWGYWEHSWTSHHVARAFPYQSQTSSQAQFLADAGPLHVTEARQQEFVEHLDTPQGYDLPADNWQRRTLAMVDVGPDQFYCVDLYRISGGKDHWWSFFAQEGDFNIQGLNLTAQPTGTLAGPDVPYGDAKWLKANGCGYGGYGWTGVNFAFPHLYNVQKAKSEGVWSADWKLKGGDGLHLRLTVPSAEGVEVNLTDGTSPAGGHPYEMKWLMLHKQGETPVKTQVLSLIEPYIGNPVIQSVQNLAVSGTDESGFAAAGCVVKLADRTDTILASADGRVEREAPGGFKFAGRYALWSERDGLPTNMCLVGGTTLSRGAFGIKIAQPEYRARITAVDRKTETITVSPAPPAPNAIRGQTIFLTNSVRRVACKVAEVKVVPGGVQLTLNYDARIAVGQVSGTADFRIQTDTPFQLTNYRYYHGARVVNAAGTAEYKVIECRGGVYLDQISHPDAKEAKLAADFPKGSWFAVYDYGVGDEVVWPYSVSVARKSGNVYQIASPVPVTVNLPTGASVR
jgi:oligo-alginate lyase